MAARTPPPSMTMPRRVTLSPGGSKRSRCEADRDVRCETHVVHTSQRRTHRSDGYPAVQRSRWAFFNSLLNEKPPLHPTAARRHAQSREIYAGQAQRSRKIRGLVLQRALSSACAYYVTREEDREGGIEYTLSPRRSENAARPDPPYARALFGGRATCRATTPHPSTYRGSRWLRMCLRRI